MNESSQSKECLICSTPNDSVHFGIDACRACATFFKRAHIAGRRIACRRSDRKCSAHRGDGPMCRGCRYDKCVAVGMVYDGPLRLGKSAIKPDMEYALCPVSRSDSLLDRFAREHTAYIERQRISEMELVRKYNLERLSHPSEEVYMANFDFAMATFNSNAVEMWNFVRAVFPELNHLPYDDQRDFYRQICMPAFGLVDCFYRTKEIWGGFDKYAMCSVVACTDMRHPEVWAGAHKDGPMRDAVIELINAYFHDQTKLVIPAFKKADICEREKNALLVLILCESDLQIEFTDRMQQLIAKIRCQILEDLHRFYTEEHGLSEYSTRLGNLLTLCHTFKEGNVLFQEFFRMQVTVFDLYETETMLKDLIL